MAFDCAACRVYAIFLGGRDLRWPGKVRLAVHALGVVMTVTLSDYQKCYRGYVDVNVRETYGFRWETWADSVERCMRTEGGLAGSTENVTGGKGRSTR